MAAPAWARGMERVSPGVYLDKDNALHFYAVEMCEAHGYPATRANVEILEAVARETMKKVFPNARMVEVSGFADPR
jgi:hypothetical protein